MRSVGYCLAWLGSTQELFRLSGGDLSLWTSGLGTQRLKMKFMGFWSKAVLLLLQLFFLILLIVIFFFFFNIGPLRSFFRYFILTTTPTNL